MFTNGPLKPVSLVPHVNDRVLPGSDSGPRVKVGVSVSFRASVSARANLVLIRFLGALR